MALAEFLKRSTLRFIFFVSAVSYVQHIICCDVRGEKERERGECVSHFIASRNVSGAIKSIGALLFPSERSENALLASRFPDPLHFGTRFGAATFLHFLLFAGLINLCVATSAWYKCEARCEWKRQAQTTFEYVIYQNRKLLMERAMFAIPPREILFRIVQIINYNNAVTIAIVLVSQ